MAADRAAQEAAHLPPRYVGRCAHLTADQRAQRRAEGRRPVIRFRVGEGRVDFHDLVRGDVSIDVDALGGDLVIVRSDGTPLYHFTVVVDDAAMAISHVIRGEDHLSNTPKHILLFRALGAEVPQFAHLPLILNPDRTKMSKRKSQTAVADYIAQGYVREAIVNHLALLGWSPGDDEEILVVRDARGQFDLDRVQPNGAVFDTERLDWLNGQWVRRLPDAELVERTLPFLVRSVADRPRQGRRPWRAGRPGADRPAAPGARAPPAAGRDRADGRLPVRRGPGRGARPAGAQAVGRRDHGRGLRVARVAMANLGEVSFEAEELEDALRAVCEERGWKGRRPVHGGAGRHHGSDGHAALFNAMVCLGYARTLGRLDAARLAVETTRT
ncbi:MAG: glutamate--tRNA ligase family protein [Chloroflexota bacterium]